MCFVDKPKQPIFKKKLSAFLKCYLRFFYLNVRFIIPMILSVLFLSQNKFNCNFKTIKLEGYFMQT